MTKAEWLLWRIHAAPGGMTSQEIRKAIFARNHPGQRFDATRHRGYWTTQLYGSCQKWGLLDRFCIKLPNGRWIVTEKIVRPFFAGKTTKTQRWNDRHRKARTALREKEAGACPSCHVSLLYRELAIDGSACIQVSGRGYKADCLDRGWTTEGLPLTLSGKQVVEATRYIFEKTRNMAWAEQDKMLAEFIENHVQKKGEA